MVSHTNKNLSDYGQATKDPYPTKRREEKGNHVNKKLELKFHSFQSFFHASRMRPGVRSRKGTVENNIKNKQQKFLSHLKPNFVIKT